MTALFAGLDLGTSSAKLLVLDAEGVVVAEASQPYPATSNVSGHSEQDPEKWWEAARAVFAKCGVGDRIVAVGLTGQMQDLIAVAGRRHLRAALLYSDTRASAQHSELVRQFPHWEQVTGNHQDVSNVAAKIGWLAQHEPAVLAAAEHILFSPAGYVAHRAGARAACDVLTASTTGLLDIDGRGWFAEVLEPFGATRLMPHLTGNNAGDDIVGEVSNEAATELGLRPGTALVLAMGDAGSTTAGLVGDRVGDAYLYLGSTGWLAAVTPAVQDHEPSPIHSLVMPGWDNRLRIGAVQHAGSASAWALATFLPGLTFEQAEERVWPRVAELSTRPLCLPGLAGERTPVRDGQFRGAFVGAHETTTSEDMYLAVLTGVAMGLRHAADEMGIRQSRLVLVGGAAKSRAWRQVLADVFGAEIVNTRASDPGAHNAAAVAADAVSARHMIGVAAPADLDEATVPGTVHQSYESQLGVHRSLYDALTPAFHRLADEVSPL